MTDPLVADRATADKALDNRSGLAFELDGGVAPRAAIGLIVLATDQTIESEFREICDLPGVGLYQSRIFNAAQINAETLKQMEAGIAAATAVILPGLPLDVVAYGCTSGAMVIGDAAFAARIHEARPGIATTTPMAAAMAAFRALGCRRSALLTPYVEEINQAMRAHIQGGGFQVPVMGSFNQEDDRKAARITAASVRDAALALGASDRVDGVFVSCTSLRLLQVIGELEAALGKPVTSSNHALAWHCLRLTGVEERLPQFGRLFTKNLS